MSGRRLVDRLARSTRHLNVERWGTAPSSTTEGSPVGERRLKLSPTEIAEAQCADRPWPLPRRAQQHLQRVLRLEDGSKVEVFDGEGARWEATYVIHERKAALVRWISIPSPAPLPEVCLAVALLKPSRWEWLVEKATEMGATTLVPMVTSWTAQRVPGDRLSPRLERWTRISDEAGRQCGRVTSMRILAPKTLEETLATGPRRWWMADEATPQCRPPTLQSREPVGILIGPEGGWSDAERSALQHRVEPFGLGPLVLRAETAAVAALATAWVQRRDDDADAPHSGNSSSWKSNPVVPEIAQRDASMERGPS